MLSPEFVERMKLKLLELKKTLEAELAGLQPHTEMGNNEDDTASEFQVDEVNQDLIVQIKSDLAKIATALTKIENGTYGLDQDGKEISPERLEVIPFADKAI